MVVGVHGRANCLLNEEDIIIGDTVVKFTRNAKLFHKLILVDGIGRSGKVMLAEILTGFDTVEKQQYFNFIEYIALGYKYNKISSDMAQTILKTQLDSEAYNLMIGRNINTRPSDYTSLYRSHSPARYLLRQGLEDGPAVMERVNEEKPVCLSWCHDMVSKSDVVFKSFGEDLLMFYMNRKPVDIIYEWDVKNFGKRIASHPTNLYYTIEFDGQQVPEIALGWEEEYLTLSPIERIVKIIHTSFSRNLEAIRSTDRINQIMIVNFEDLATQTYSVIDDISSFIGLDPLLNMEDILIRERCPRILDSEQYMKRGKDIESIVSGKYYQYVIEMEDMYNEISSYSVV